MGEAIMSTVVDAVYENGMLKLAEPLALPEGMRVRVTITPADQDCDPLEAVIGIGESGRTDGAEHHDKYIYGKIRP
jgi:predicted DNA-binding antitoxin AbrB/MazE fold protein